LQRRAHLPCGARGAASRSPTCVGEPAEIAVRVAEAGRATRRAATWNGRSPVAATPCASCSTPDVGERKETVSSASAPTTRTARTRRRTMDPALPGKRSGPRERRTDEPSTATRAVRSRDDTSPRVSRLAGEPTGELLLSSARSSFIGCS
jgi:hypothetical protein